MNKPFSEMSYQEIQDMTSKEFASVPPHEKRSCSDCGWITELISLWCGNESAVVSRGTSIPGAIKCPYWKE